MSEIEIIEVIDFVSFTIAIILLFIGKFILSRSEFLKRYSLPEPVIGGFICTSIVAGIYYLFGKEVQFSLESRDILLLYFFAGIGLKADIESLLKGGRPLLVLLLLASVYIVLQNIVGISVATLFGLDPKSGLMSGSISLIGGVGTTVAWAPVFVDKLDISNAMELGVASNTLGLISACVIGGPIATYLMKKHQLYNHNQAESLDIGTAHNQHKHITVDYFGVLRAWLWLNVSLISGYFINVLLESAGVMLPMFVSCLMAGIVWGNVGRWVLSRINSSEFNSYADDAEKGLSLIQDICLGMFLTMALMNLKVWLLEGSLLYLVVVIGLQVLLSIGFTIWVVFKAMGKDYESAVICAGFGGVTLGSTATAIVNMTAVTQQYGAAHKAFIILPLVCGFFIDVVNAVVINYFVAM